MASVVPAPRISSVTGKLQTTIPAAVARLLGIKTGTRLEWVPDPKRQSLAARVLPGADTRLRDAQKIAARNVKAAAKLGADFEADRAWQRRNGPLV